MKIVEPSFELLASTPDLELVIERAGRICYKSEGRKTESSYVNFIKRLKDSKHESVLEHGSISVIITCNRRVSHQLVRHRIASYSQESTTYCNYGMDKFDNEITVIKPGFFPEHSVSYGVWMAACAQAERSYFDLLAAGASPGEASDVLPTALKTEIVATMNPRQWLHVFGERCEKPAHPAMREVMRPIRDAFAALWPSIFGD